MRPSKRYVILHKSGSSFVNAHVEGRLVQAVVVKMSTWACEREKYVWMCNVHKFAVAQGLADNKVVVSVRSILSFALVSHNT
jgi:hypothetical protein